MDVLYLTADEVLAIHQEQITQYGGSHGLRDASLLASALAMPEATFAGEYLHPDIPAMAAAYLFHIVSNHPFIDGNKRTGVAVAFHFLALNDFTLRVPEAVFEPMVWDIAEGRCEKDTVIAFFRQHLEAW